VARPRLIPRKSARKIQPIADSSRERRTPSAIAEPAASDVPEFDRVIHERMRLGIVSALAVNDSLSFNDLKRLLNTTDGNLSVHARKLEEASYVICRKRFEGRVPRTEYTLTPAGRSAFETYLLAMEGFIQRTRGGR
jgi:DNA-binding HxlR family transcriptional regulator